MSLKFASNSSWLILGNLLENTTLLLLNLFLIRIFGTQIHGVFIIFFSAMVLIKIGVDLGLSPHITKMAGKYWGSPKMLQPIFLFAVIHAAAALVIGLGARWALPKFKTEILFFALWFTGLSFYSLAISIFNGRRKMQYSFLIIFIFEALKIGGIIYLWRGESTLQSYLGFMGIGNALASMVVIYLLIKLAGPWKIRGPTFPLRAGLHLKTSLVLWVPNGIIVLFPQLLNVMIGGYLPKSDVSLFATLHSWSMVGFVILSPLANALFSHVSSMEEQTLEENAPLFNTYGRVIGTFSLSTATLLLMASPLLLKIYGSEFVSHYAVFAILLFAQLAEYPRFVSRPILSGGPYAAVAMKIESLRIGASVGIVFVLLVAGYSTMAIALSLLVTQFLFSTGRLIAIKRLHGIGSLYAFLKITAGFLLITGVFQTPYTYALKAAIGAILLVIFSGVKPKDIAALRNLITSKPK